MRSSSGQTCDAMWIWPFVLALSSGCTHDSDSKGNAEVTARAQACGAHIIYSNGDVESHAADGVGEAARFEAPVGIAIDSKGTLYVADYGNDVAVRKITSDRVVTTLAGTPGHQGCADGPGNKASFYGTNAIAVDRDSVIYVADGGTNKIRLISPAGVVSTLATRFPDAISEGLTGHFPSLESTTPQGLAVGADGSIYVTIIDAVVKIGPDRRESVFAGNPLRFRPEAQEHRQEKGEIDGPRGVARFDSVNGIAIDRDGRLYITDEEADTVRVISEDGTVKTLAGMPEKLRKDKSNSADGTGSAARFSVPEGIAVSDDDYIYVADKHNHSIRRIAPDGVVSTLAGMPGQPGSRDGKGSEARFVAPTAIAIDKQGDLFVTDVADQTIRKIKPDGTVTTFAGSSRFSTTHQSGSK